MTNKNIKEGLQSGGPFQVAKIIYDDEQFGMAKGFWDAQGQPCVACRWYDKGIGFPQSRGHRMWLVFPDTIGDFILSIRNMVNYSK